MSPRYRALALLFYTIVIWTPASAGAQDTPITATAIAKNCNDAKEKAFLQLLENHGYELIRHDSEEDTTVVGRRGATKFTSKTSTVIAGLFNGDMGKTYIDKSGDCVADITLTRDELENSRNSALVLLQSEAAQERLIGEVRGDIRRDIDESVNKSVERAFKKYGRPANGTGGASQYRMPLWPFTVALTATVTGVSAMSIEEYRLHEGIRNGASLDTLNGIIAQREQWRTPTYAVATAAVGYLVIRQVAGRVVGASNSIRVGFAPGKVEVVWGTH